MSILDRYIIRQFLGTLIFSIGALSIIFLIVNVLESLDKFIDQKVNISIILSYYIHFLPEIIKLLLPIAMLMAALFSIGRLSNQSEITAMKSGGMSLYRLMFPLFIISLCITAGHLYFNGWIVPESNKKKLTIERRDLRKDTDRTSVSNLFLRDSSLRNIVMQYYDGITKSGSGISIEEYTSEHIPRIKKRIDAETIQWDSTKHIWVLGNAFERVLKNDSTFHFVFSSYKKLQVKLTLHHADIMRLQQSPSELNFDEQKLYISLLEKGGKDIRMQLIDYYSQFAFPFANVIVILFAIPFAAVRKKSGLAIEIATAMIVSFVYLACTKIGQNIGYSMQLDPILVGWLPNIIFIIIAFLNIFRMRT